MNRLGIYTALGVMEVWQYDRDILTMVHFIKVLYKMGDRIYLTRDSPIL